MKRTGGLELLALGLFVTAFLGCGGFAVATRQPSEAPRQGAAVVTLKHDDGTREGQGSIAGSGHAVFFTRPPGEWYMDKAQIFGSRYGYPTPPDEDFVVYLTDADMNVIAEARAPYARFERGDWRWVFVDLPRVPAPDEFALCVSFDPTRTKGVYVGYDEGVAESHSKRALPGSHLEDVKGTFDWMIRLVLTSEPSGEEGR